MTPNLWWVYNEDEASFSTLPTGPFLVPALFIAGIAVLWRNCFDRRHTVETIAGELVNTEYWQRKHKRYRELVSRLVETNNNLTLSERHEYNQLKAYMNNPWGY